MIDETDIDILMALDPLELSAQNIDAIIAYQRNQRAKKAAGGGKAKKDTGRPKLDLKALGLVKAPSSGDTIVRRRI